MSALRRRFFIVVALAGLGCDRGQPAAKESGSEAPAETPAPPPSRFAATGWPEDAGPVVILPTNNSSDVQLILPELSDRTLSDTSSFTLDSLPNSAVALFSQSGKVTAGTIVEGGSEEIPKGCKTWPKARVQPYPSGWRFGLAQNTAIPLPLSAWGPALVSDSAHAAREIIRLAGESRSNSVFGGIPFSVRFLFRLDLSDGRAVIADAVRRINTEANVREEHVLIIAERSHGAARYMPAFRERQSGREDKVRVPEVLGAVFLGDNRRPALFVSLEYSEGARLLLLERQGSGRWTVRWRSAYSGC